MLSFDCDQKPEDIYSIKEILHIRVKIEPLRKNNKPIPQCKKCQSYNHTQNYCGRKPRCVKCAGMHQSTLCSVEKTQPAKCANCQGNHTANYRGCEVAKELQKIREHRKQNQNPSKSQVISKPNTIASKSMIRNVGDFKTYAQALTSAQEKPMQKNSPGIQEITILLNAINKRLEEQDKTNAIVFESLKKLASKIN